MPPTLAVLAVPFLAAVGAAAPAPIADGPIEPLKVNHPPVIASDHEYVTLGGRDDEDDPAVVDLRADDEDGDVLHYSVEGLPKGATVRQPSDHDSGARVTLGRSDLGEMHWVVSVNDGKATTTGNVTVTVEEHWDSYALPGLAYTGYAPAKAGPYRSGFAFELVMASWIHDDHRRGPSHGRFYLDFEVLTPARKVDTAAFLPAIGFDLSLERNPHRRYLLPFFGLETGAFVQKEVKSFGVFTPYAGLYLYASPMMFLDVSAGYMLPAAQDSFDAMRGARLKAALNFALW